MIKGSLLKLVFFTDRKRFDNIFEIIRNLPKGSTVIVREYDLSYAKRLEFATRVALIAQQQSFQMLVGKSLRIAIAIKAHGVHFSDRDKLWNRHIYCKKVSHKKFIFSLSCHKIKSLNKAKEFNFDMAFYSPIFQTNSHPDQRHIGILKFRKVALDNFNSFGVPLYALGGVNKTNIKLLKSCKIAGVGGISQVAYL